MTGGTAVLSLDYTWPVLVRIQVIIERMVDRWSGSIEAGVTLVPPEELSFPRTMTDIEYDTWMISGSAVMKVSGESHGDGISRSYAVNAI